MHTHTQKNNPIFLLIYFGGFNDETDFKKGA